MYLHGIRRRYEGYKLWRLELGEMRCFVTFNETQMTIDPEKGKEKVHVEVVLFDDGSDCLVMSDDEASNYVN